MTAEEMFEKLGYEKLDSKNLLYKKKHFSGFILRIAFFDNKKILITESIGLEDLQAINKQVEELGWYE